MSAASTATVATTITDTIHMNECNADGNERSRRGETTSMPCGQSVVSPQADLETAIRTILCLIGEDPNREGLQDTPARYAKALIHLTKGCSERVEDVVNDAIFTVDNNDLVIVRDIDIASTCEHYLLPFFGKMHIGYIPDGRVLGLSKLVRIAQVFSYRLQIQERLTSQVAAAIEKLVSSIGVAVISECTHMCMVARGVEKARTSTLSQSMIGLLKDDPKKQEQFCNLLRSRQN